MSVQAPRRRASRLPGPLPRPPSQQADVAVVVVTHDSSDVIDECLESIPTGAPGLVVDVVVVDNASRDGTADIVRRQHPHVRLLAATSRAGFSENCNLGAQTVNARHLLLLNPDTVVRPGAIASLVEHLDQNPEVGAAAPRAEYRDGQWQASVRRFPTVASVLVRRTPLRLVWKHSHIERRHLRGDELATATEPTDIDWALGAALVVRGEVWEALAGMDEGYRLYCEDIDLCWRIHQSGWRVRYVPSGVIAHDLGEHTRRSFFTIRTWWHLKSMVRFVLKHGFPRGRGDARRSVAAGPTEGTT